MNQTITTLTHFCGCCKQELPIEAFYLNKKTQCADNYCKECRKASSRMQREHINRIRIVNNKRVYPIITRLKDPALRLELIRHALQVVHESMRRKQRQQHEIEYENF